MAVSGKGPAPREVPFPLLSDTPDIEAYGKEVAETLSNYASFGVGLLAARPAAVAKNEGHIYWATDDTTFGPNGTWWVSYGAAWHEMPLMTVTTVLLAALSVTTAKLGEESVTEPKLANESVGEGKIKNLAVTAAKIAASTITAAKIAAEAIGTAALANLGVTTAKIAELAVTAAKIAAEAVTDAKVVKGRALVNTESVWTTNAIKEEGIKSFEHEFSATRETEISVGIVVTGTVAVSIGGVRVLWPDGSSAPKMSETFFFLRIPPGKKLLITSGESMKLSIATRTL